jgi:hypothetical protein
MDETKRKQAATAVIHALESQSGIDVLPAQAALPRILTGIFKMTGFKFTLVGHGRMRDVFNIVSPPPHEDLGLVLKLGSKQATARDIALTLAYPDDRARIYAATDYGVVVERVDCISQISDPRITTPEYMARGEEFTKRYIGVSYADTGYVGDRIVMVGSSTRVIKHDEKSATSSTQQVRTV